MKPTFSAVFGLALLAAGHAPVLARVSELPPGTVKPRFTEPQAVVRLFLEAVDRGELTAFGKRLDKSMLTPLRVEYVYELDDPTPKVRVYSELKQPMTVPERDCKLRGINAVLDAEGAIVDAELHVWPD